MNARTAVALTVATLALAIAGALEFGPAVRAGIIAIVCLALWLTGSVPVWFPTIVLWVATPLLLGLTEPGFGPLAVVSWSLDPVLALFLAGFTLAAAARRYGVDSEIAAFALRRAGASPIALIGMAASATVFLSMWMSNVAAAALMFHAFRPIWNEEADDAPLRRALLLAIALAANIGGIATPIGAGANAIAMAAISSTEPVSFLRWMVFGTPLAVGLVIAAVVLVLVRFRLPALKDRTGAADAVDAETAPSRSKPQFTGFVVILATTVTLWLTEPLHHIPAWQVSLGAVVLLIVFRVVTRSDMAGLDWGTLMLVAGGIGLGALLEKLGIVHELARLSALSEITGAPQLFVVCLIAATLSALMSNTATAAILIPVALSVNPAPSTAIIVAVACSLGMPFVVSTPPNAMAVASGVRTSDLLVPGVLILIAGCALVAWTGPSMLRLVGIA